MVSHPATEEYKKDYPHLAFKVTCVTLWQLLALHHIDASTAFIKIDTEGAEWSIVPSLHPWLTSLANKKPTLAISLHPNSEDIVRKALPDFLAVLRLFAYSYCWPPLNASGPSDIALAMKTPSTEITQADFLACHKSTRDWVATDF
jgi:hypothetical protein